mgnify:CR=1 FL=1
MESLFHISNIEFVFVRPEETPGGKRRNLRTFCRKLTLDFHSRRLSGAILKAAARPQTAISILHTQTMLNYVLLTATPGLREENTGLILSPIGPYLTLPPTR